LFPSADTARATTGIVVGTEYVHGPTIKLPSLLLTIPRLFEATA
jgi:hypothetical protein